MAVTLTIGALMLELLYTPGSPFARAIRILLHELDVDYRGIESDGSLAQRREHAATLQVPALRKGDFQLWESGLIADYLLSHYGARAAEPLQVAASIWRDEHEWEDKLLFETIQTFGTAATTISQMTWTGVSVAGNSHLQRSAERMHGILDWLELQLGPERRGFFGETLSAQDVFLVCHIDFVRARPLGIEVDLDCRPGISELVLTLHARTSLRENPIWWWEPGVIGHEADGTPIFEAH